MASFFIMFRTVVAATCTAKDSPFVCLPGQGCVNGTCATCSLDSHCDSQLFCQAGSCVHKSFFPLTFQNVLVMFLALLISAMGGATGLGGGSFLVPTYSLLNHFQSAQTVGLAQANLFGNGLTSFLFGIFDRHPFRNKSRVDYDVLFVMMAPLLMGSFLGSFVSSIMPQYLVMILLTIFLGYSIFNSAKRAVKQNKKEKVSALHDAHPSINDEGSSVIHSEKSPLITQEVKKDSNYVPQTDDPELAKLYKKERRPPLRKSLFCLLTWTIMFLVALARGSKGAPSLFGIKRCSVADWMFFGGYIVVSILLTIVAGVVLIKEYKRKVKMGYEFAEGSISWTVKTGVAYPLFCMFGGVLAGLLGVGGGIVTSPVLMSMGMLVPVTTSTTSALILFSASGSTVQFATSGLLPLDFGLMSAITGVLGAFLGGLFARFLVRKNKSSMLVWLMVIMYAGSTVLAVYNSIVSITSLIRSGGSWGFRSVC